MDAAAPPPTPPRTIIVVPCFNEEHRLPKDAFVAFGAEAARLGITFLFVNDGSSDGTVGVLRGLEAAQPERFSVLDLARNGGKAEAVRRGFLQAFAGRPAAVGFLDADLATPLDELPLLMAALGANPGTEIVLGSRVNLLGRAIHRRLSRHYLGRVFATVASLYLKWPVYDTQCGAKVFRNTARVRSLFRRRFVSRWIFDVELLVRFRKACERAGVGDGRERLYEVPLRRWEDVKGSKVKGRDFAKALAEFVRIVATYR